MKDTHQQLARNSTASTRDDNETIFDFEQLSQELAHPDERRWKPSAHRDALVEASREPSSEGIVGTRRDAHHQSNVGKALRSCRRHGRNPRGDRACASGGRGSIGARVAHHQRTDQEQRSHGGH
jgi:hypothetical protein